MTRIKLAVLALLPLVSLSIGFMEYGPAHGTAFGSALATVHAMTAVAVIFAWFWLDARERQYRPSLALQVCMAVLCVFALPYYLFRTRGFVGGVTALTLSLGVFVATMAFYRAGVVLG